MNDVNSFRSFDLTPPRPPRDPTRLRLSRLFIDYNPFYLLSALCMLAGLFSLNDSLDWSPLPQHNLLWLILILNTYELLLIVLGIFLFHRGLQRDAATLFILEAFFLVDAGFLNSEIFTADFRLGIWVNAGLMFLALVKVSAVFVGLGVSLRDGRFPLILAQMCILLAAPGLFKYVAMHNAGRLPPIALYGVWWAVGLIPILYLLLLRGPQTAVQRGILSAFVLLPAVSILAHLCTSNWVYHVRWYHANLSPLLLGLAVAIGASERHVTSVAARMRAELVIPVLAIILSAIYPVSLVFTPDLFHVNDIVITPMRLVLLGAAMVYVHGLLIHRHPYFGVAGAMCLTAAGLGESPEKISSHLATAGDKTGRSFWKLIPQTVAGWGIVSVASSFVLLALGLVVSLLKTRHRPSADETLIQNSNEYT